MSSRWSTSEVFHWRSLQIIHLNRDGQIICMCSIHRLPVWHLVDLVDDWIVKSQFSIGRIGWIRCSLSVLINKIKNKRRKKGKCWIIWKKVRRICVRSEFIRFCGLWIGCQSNRIGWIGFGLCFHNPNPSWNGF